MKIPNDLKRAALAAHRDRVCWNDFLKDYVDSATKFRMGPSQATGLTVAVVVIDG